MSFKYDNEDLDLHTEGFNSTLSLAPQNELNLLLPAVSYDPNPADGDYFDADFLKPSNPQKAGAFNAPTPDKEIAAIKRVGMYEFYDDSAWINNHSELHGLSDPSSPIMQSLEAGRQRYRQAEILRALNGPGYQYKVDKSGAFTTRLPVEKAFPTAQIIPVGFAKKHESETINGSGNQNVTIGKWNRARTMTKKAKIVGGKVWNIIDEDGLEVLLNKAILTTREGENADNLKEGGIGRLLGHNWIVLPDEMPEVSSGVRAYFTVNSRAIVYKTRKVVEAKISPRADRSHALQAYYKDEHGAARMIDEGVVQINVDLNA